MKEITMKIFLALSLLLSSTVAVASSPPFPVQNVKTHQADGLSRLRIHLAVSSNNDSGEINVSNLTLCSALACWKTEINRYIPVANSVTAKGELIADVFVPENELIKEIFFGKTVGKQSIGGGLKLSEAVKIDAEYQGTNLYVVLNKFRKNSGATEYFPIATTALPYNPEAKYYLIDPKFNQNIDLSSTSTVGFPVGFLEKPQLFTITEHDVGKKFPMLDIYPYVQGVGNLGINISEVVKASNSQRGTLRAYTKLVSSKTRLIEGADSSANSDTVRTAAE